MSRDNGILTDVTEGRELCSRLILERIFRATNEDVWNYSQSSKFFHRVLSRFGFLFTDRPHHRD